MRFKVKAGNLQTMYLVSICIHIPLSWSDLDPGSGSKMLQRYKIFRKVCVGCD